MKKRKVFNPKRRLRAPVTSIQENNQLKGLAAKVKYGGNPEHKGNPSDFNLDPPSEPRQGKTLCDQLGSTTHAKALDALRDGISKGLISVQERNGWPQNVWTVYEGKHPVEAMLENAETGTYHGYPMPLNDPFRDLVLKRWKSK